MAQTTDSIQTTTDWIKENLESFGDPTHISLTWETLDEILEEAKARERQQHSNTWIDSRICRCSLPFYGKEKTFEEYYTETYNK